MIGCDNMDLVTKINDDLKNAMKNKDKDKLNVIRMIKSSIQLAKIDLKREPNDDDVIDIISKQIKMRKDSIAEFTKAKRDDLVSQYQAEIDVLKTYMPEQLSLEEVEKIIDQAISDIKPTSKKQMGIIIKEVSPKVKGKFDMGEVSKIVKDRLENLG